MRQAKPLQQAPNRRALHIDAAFLPQGCDQLVKRRCGLAFKAGANPFMAPRKLAMTAPTLRLGFQRARFPFQPNHVVDELDGNAKTPGRLGVCIALFDKRDGTLA